MERRAFLATAGAAIAAGCVGAEGDDVDLQESVEHDLLQVSFRLYLKENIQYLDSGELQELEPDRDFWALAGIRLRNLDSETRDAPDPDDFQLVAGGDPHPPTDLDRISWDQVRFRDEGRSYWEEPYTPEKLKPDRYHVILSLYDVPDSEPHLRWGVDDKTYHLEPKRVFNH